MIALNKQVTAALRQYYPKYRGDYILASNCKDRATSCVQAWGPSMKPQWNLGSLEKFRCHSLRKTFACHAWTRGKVSLVVIVMIYNHSNYKVTRRYLGEYKTALMQCISK